MCGGLAFTSAPASPHRAASGAAALHPPDALLSAHITSSCRPLASQPTKAARPAAAAATRTSAAATFVSNEADAVSSAAAISPAYDA